MASQTQWKMQPNMETAKNISFPGAPSTLESLMQTATQPLEEVRVPTFALMQAIASHSWGQEVSSSLLLT